MKTTKQFNLGIVLLTKAAKLRAGQIIEFGWYWDFLDNVKKTLAFFNKWQSQLIILSVIGWYYTYH